MSGGRKSPVLRILGGLVAAALLGRAFWEAAGELRSFPIHPSVLPALLALLGIFGTFLFTIVTWQTLFRDLGVRLAYRDAVRLWSFSNIGRYLPGKIWQVVGMVVVARELGVPGGLSAAAAFLSFGFMVSSGALMGLLFLQGAAFVHPWVGWTAVALASGLLVPIAWPGLFNAVFRRLPSSLGCSLVPEIPRGAIVRFAVLQCLAWVGHGVSFYVFARALASPPVSELARFAGSYSLAYVGGLVALFAPGGLGVREGLLGVMLGTVGLGDLPVHVLAVAARLWAIGAEILVFALAMLLRPTRGPTS
ncbi:MAG: hypothetical protein R3B81_18400 [bacterium]